MQRDLAPHSVLKATLLSLSELSNLSCGEWSVGRIVVDGGWGAGGGQEWRLLGKIKDIC